jgi:hypothetical protein
VESEPQKHKVSCDNGPKHIFLGDEAFFPTTRTVEADSLLSDGTQKF